METTTPNCEIPTRRPTNGHKPKAYRLVSRQERPQDTIVTVGSMRIGSERLAIIAGPCAVESREQVLQAARIAKQGGAGLFRGGAFKPRTSPYDFQGLGEEALEILAEAREATGLPLVTEVVDSEDVEMVSRYADVLQIGARNMSAFRLLQRAAQTGKPILLKRGFQASIREYLLSAEYILAQGNDQVILCERGIRTFDSEFTRNTLDLSAVPVLKAETHLPVIVDPSHGTGRADLVPIMARGAIAVGADGIIVEIHPNPADALCDGVQSLDPVAFADLVTSLRPLSAILNRSI